MSRGSSQPSARTSEAPRISQPTTDTDLKQRVQRLPQRLRHASLQFAARLGLPGARRQLAFTQALAVSPRPLVDTERQLMLLFSPKSACTSAVIWFYQQAGLIDVARKYDRWPHRYRTRVFNQGNAFDRAAALGLDKFRIVRVVREPLSRCVSSFRHALASDYARKELNAVLGMPLEGPLSLSFEQWVDFLERSDLFSCDTHHRVQYHPVERLRKPDFIINVSRQDLYTELNRIEQLLGLPHTDFPNLDWLQRMHRHRDFHHRIDLVDAASVPLGREEARNGPWPTNGALLRDDLKARLRVLYRVDFDAYEHSAIDRRA
jgi:hypothetical protein